MNIYIYKLKKNPLRKLIKNHAGSSISETVGSRNGSPAVGLAVSGHPSDSKSWRLEPRGWMMELGNWKVEPRSQKSEPGSWKLESGAPGPFWVVEGRTPFRGASKSGPRDPWAQYINRLIDKRVKQPAGQKPTLRPKIK